MSKPGDDIRRLVGWALVAGLSIAALTAVVALLAGDFDERATRVILTSLGFAISSSVAGAGTAPRLQSSPALRRLGAATAALAAISFVLLVAGLWTGDWGTEGIWRSFGCAAVLAIAGAHACIVLGARRRTDSDAVSMLVLASLVLAAVDTVGAVLPIAGIVDEVDPGAQFFGVTLVLLVFTSLLPPLLRRLEPARAGSTRPRQEALDVLTEEVATIADRIEHLASGPALRTPEIRREAERLRKLARNFQA